MTEEHSIAELHIEQSPAEGDGPPMEGDRPPMEGDRPPMEGDRPPMEGDRPPTEGDRPPVGRREFLTGALAGGVASLAAAAGTGGAVWRITDADAKAAIEAADAAARVALGAANAEAQEAIEAARIAARAAIEAAEAAAQTAIEAERADARMRVRSAQAEAQAAQDAVAADNARLLGLVDLYEGLEGVGLDAILRAGMLAVNLPLQAVELGAKALMGGVSLVKGSLRSLEEALPRAQESLRWLEGRVSSVADAVENLETALGRALGTISRSPIAEGMKDFAERVLDHVPFGLGDKFQDVLAGLVSLVGGLDELIEGVNVVLLEPLRVHWFSADEGEGIGAVLVNPLVENVLDPLESQLDDLDALVDAWQKQLVEPVEQALADRATMRARISEYRTEQGLG